jgi:hypothetical protein
MPVHGVSVSDDWTPGTLVRLNEWMIRTHPTLHLEAMTVSLIGAQDMGMVGNPLDIRRTVEVRRVMEHLSAQQLASKIPELGDAVSLLKDSPLVVDALMAAVGHRKPHQLTTSIEQNIPTQRAAALTLGDAVALLDQPKVMEALMAESSAAAEKRKPRHDDDKRSMASWNETFRNPHKSDVTPLRTNTTMKMPLQTILVPAPDLDDKVHNSNDDDDYEPKGISAMLTDTLSSSEDDHDGNNHDKPHYSTDNRKRPAILDTRTVSSTLPPPPPPPQQASFRQTRQLFQALLDPARKNNTSPQLQPPRPHQRSLRLMPERRKVATAKSK